jgi:type I restriction enzyme S subunit
MEDLGNLPVPFPSKKERDEITEFLNFQTTRIDDLISKNNEEILMLREYRTTLISEVVTGKIDVREEVHP